MIRKEKERKLHQAQVKRRRRIALKEKIEKLKKEEEELEKGEKKNMESFYRLSKKEKEIDEEINKLKK